MAAKAALGDLIRRYRHAAELTQEALAERAGLSVREIRNLERGIRHHPRPDTLQLLLDALAVPPEERRVMLTAAHDGSVVEGITPMAIHPAAVNTFLITDIRGYTRFTLEHGDEAGARLAARFAEITRETVRAGGGDVIELRGDEALAVFTSSRAALRTAAELQGRFTHEMVADSSLPLRVGMGLDAGEAVRVEGGFRGSALNLAARLCALAGPGEVLASDGVTHLAQKIDGLEYVERGFSQLKGFADPVRVIEVRPAAAPTDRSDRRAADTSSMHRLPIGGFLGSLPAGALVARDSEMQRIGEAIEVAVGGTGQMITLSGEPGAGKTRLAQEVTLVARNRGFLVAAGRCYEGEQSVPYYPFREALTTLVATCSPELRASIPGRWPDLQILLPGAVAGALGSQGQEEQQRLFWAVSEFIGEVSKNRPVALLLDDLHWADVSSLKLLHHVARRTRDERVYTLATYRDVEVGRQHPLEATLLDLTRDGLVQRIAVPRLDREGTRALVASTMGEQDISNEFTDLVYWRTEGNPFFVQQVLRMLVERGDVYREDGRWERKEIAEIDVPESIRSVVGQRFERLSVETQGILREAAVLGQVFYFDDLLAMAEYDEDDLEAALDEAIRSGLVREMEGDRYGFDHALTQQALYGELSRRRRRRLHRAAGEVIERLPERQREGIVAELAWHFLHAGETEKALQYSLEAGDEAESVFAHDEAAKYYHDALGFARQAQDLRAEAESAERLAAVKMIQAEYTDALTLLERALDTYRLARIAGGEKAIAMLGRLHADRGTVQEGIIRLQDLLRLPEIVKAPGNAAVAHVALSRLHFYAGHYEESLQSAEQAEILATRGQDNVVLADAQLRRSSALQLLGRLPESIQVGEMGITMLERSGNQESLARALHTVGTAYLFTGAVRESRDRLSRALDAAYRLGHRSLVALIEPFLCDAWFHLGDWARAQFHAEHLRLRLADETSWYAAHSLIAAGRLELARGDGETATRLLEDAADRARRSDNDIAWCWAQILLADHDVVNGSSSTAIARLQEAIPVRGAYLAGVLPVLAAATLDEGDVGRAAEWARQGVQRTRRDGTDLLLVEALRALAVVLGRREDWDGAERAFTEGLSMTRNHGLPFAEARTLHQYGVMSASRGEVDWARQRYDQALTIFRRLGAGPWIRRLEGEIAGLA